MGRCDLNRGLAIALTAGWLLSGPAARGAHEADGVFEPIPKNLAETCSGGDHLHFVLLPAGQRNAVLACGGVGKQDAPRFAAALNQAGPVEEIVLYSPGGVLSAGIDIGYLIHDRKFSTRVPSGYFCASACNFMLMGGIVRTVEPGAHFIVHMFSATTSQLNKDLSTPPHTLDEYYEKHHKFGFDRAKLTNYLKEHNKTLQQFLLERATEEDIKDIEQNSALEAAEIAEFLVRMRLSLHFLTAFANIPNDTPKELTREELVQYNITND